LVEPSYARARELLAGERLPAAWVDLDALDRNLERVLALVRRQGLRLRVATKSVRVVRVLQRLLERGQGLLQGLMCYSCEEAEFLAAQGFDDLLVAYPPFRRGDLERIARLTAEGRLVSIVCDSREAVEQIAEIGAARGVRIKTAICVDMSLRLFGGRMHLGVRRSPVHNAEQVVELAQAIQSSRGAEFFGLMAYEAQVAGLGDDNPFDPRKNPLKTAVKRASVLELTRRRAAIVRALRRAGLDPVVVNGGGSGSLDTTTLESGVTEVTAGSAFYKSHLFDYYKNAHMRELEPAAFFALEVTRKPTPELVTCLGGGYIASGPPGADRAPRPWLPSGLRLLPGEMAGEVQTPLALPRGARIDLGDPIVFRHAKAGELAERFNEFLFVQQSRVVDRVPTYRGQGRCFF
jgi:D-serine deaminase-like pyridoxal phosphate-dependent protein